jgi:UPF0755 protein
MYTRIIVTFRRFAGLAVVVAALAFETWRVVTPAVALREGPLTVDIPANGSALGVAGRLGDAGAIRSPTGFVALSLVRGSLRSLKAGEYEIPQGASTVEILALLENGRVRQHPILHPEGASVAELARMLEQGRLASATDVVRVATDAAFLQSQGIDGPSAEGYLFPDTYNFIRGMSPEQMLGRMIQRMQGKLTPELRERARAKQLTVHELLTLASIVEREAVAREERPVIAAVFWNRLRLAMPLQADPTVQYAVGRERRALSRADLATDHPYNTYMRVGLPPGPIASPGVSAIEAVLDPAPVKYLYFVKKDDQRHYFSMTVEEHKLAVARYRLARTR